VFDFLLKKNYIELRKKTKIMQAFCKRVPKRTTYRLVIHKQQVNKKEIDEIDQINLYLDPAMQCMPYVTKMIMSCFKEVHSRDSDDSVPILITPAPPPSLSDSGSSLPPSPTSSSSSLHSVYEQNTNGSNDNGPAPAPAHIMGNESGSGSDSDDSIKRKKSKRARKNNKPSGAVNTDSSRKASKKQINKN